LDSSCDPAGLPCVPPGAAGASGWSMAREGFGTSWLVKPDAGSRRADIADADVGLAVASSLPRASPPRSAAAIPLQLALRKEVSVSHLRVIGRESMNTRSRTKRRRARRRNSSGSCWQGEEAMPAEMKPASEKGQRARLCRAEANEMKNSKQQ